MNYENILKTPEARENFIRGMICLAKADGIISDDEQSYFLTAAGELGLDAEHIANIQRDLTTEGELNISFETAAEKILFLREGIQICMVDESYDVKEKAEIRRLAKSMNVPSEIVAMIEAWAEEGMAWKRLGDQFLAISF